VKIFDTFLFRDELDLLECRLTEMDDWPLYTHVLVEATTDHQGHRKPLAYAENKERFAAWSDQVVHVVVDDLPAGAAPMDTEAAQREGIGRGLGDAEPGDWIIIADVDEIPNQAALGTVQDRQQGVFEMTCCMFAVDWLWGIPLKTSVSRPLDGITSFAAARRDGWTAGPALPGTGHHLTWLGGQAGIQAKMDSHCHTEVNDALDRGNGDDLFYRQGHNPFGNFGYTDQLVPVDVDGTWPRWVRERRCPPGWFRPRQARMA
jgi:hypothetical protein